MIWYWKSISINHQFNHSWWFIPRHIAGLWTAGTTIKHHIFWLFSPILSQLINHLEPQLSVTITNNINHHNHEQHTTHIQSIVINHPVFDPQLCHWSEDEVFRTKISWAAAWLERGCCWCCCCCFLIVDSINTDDEFARWFIQVELELHSDRTAQVARCGFDCCEN